MRLHKILFCLYPILPFISLKSQLLVKPDEIKKIEYHDSLLTTPKNWLNAAGISVGINMGVWSFDRYITRSPWTYIDANTINQNIKTGFVWDNDMFLTNLFLHPYHGGLYFNAARSNGFNYWQSVPFAAGGSLLWEFCMENESPSINDFVATTIGGMCLGEMTFRLSDRIKDDRALGFERLMREVLLTLISPTRGLNRLISGEAWKHRNIKGSTLPATPVTFQASIGDRLMAEDIKKKLDFNEMICFDLKLNYGNPYDLENDKPYDFFFLKVGGTLFSQQPTFSHVNALGMLYSKNIKLKKTNRQLTLGIFQHFNFYQSVADTNSININPYKISEAASVGPGLLYQVKLKNHISYSISTYLSSIILGGSQTDHYRFDERDYNMGSGFSSKLNLELNFNSKLKIRFHSEDYRIYSWVGYDPNDTENSSTNVQGDIGNASLSVASLGFSYFISKHFILETESSLYFRSSIYKYYPDVEHSVRENKISLGYIF